MFSHSFSSKTYSLEHDECKRQTISNPLVRHLPVSRRADIPYMHWFLAIAESMCTCLHNGAAEILYSHALHLSTGYQMATWNDQTFKFLLCLLSCEIFPFSKILWRLQGKRKAGHTWVFFSVQPGNQKRIPPSKRWRNSLLPSHCILTMAPTTLTIH